MKHTRSKRSVKSPPKSPKITDPVASQYFLEVGRYALPTKEQERKLFQAYADARHKSEHGRSSQDRNQGARELAKIGREIACGYLRFVIQQAGRKTSDATLLKDLIGQGNIGLMVGISHFDLKFKTRFLTYAASWIRVYMQEHLHKLGVVHVPSHTRKELHKKTDDPDAKAKRRNVEEPAVTDLDGVTLPSDDDVQRNVSRRELGSLQALQTPGLTLVERLTLTYSFGLRGVELSNTQLAQFIYDLGLGTHTAKSLNIVKCEALTKLKSAYAAKGVRRLNDVL